MVTIYHKSVQKALVSYGKELSNKRIIRKVHEGNKRPLSIVDSRSKFVVNYQPDVYFILKNNKKFIFEILDSEDKKQDIIIADIIRAILVENTDSVIFIYHSGAKEEKIILEALKTIWKGLTDLGVDIKDLPDDKKTGPYLITKIIARNEKILYKKIREYFPFGNQKSI